MAQSSSDHMTQHVTDALGSDPAAVENSSGFARYLIPALDKAVHIQGGAITAYVNWLRRHNPDASPTQIQEAMDKHFVMLATGSGAGVGAAAAVPGIGFVTGALAIGAESLVFLDAAAFYTVASAHLRGVDIRDPERRRALILVVLLGSAGTAIVDAAVGDLAKQSSNMTTVKAISRFSASNLIEVNSRMLKLAIGYMGKRMRRAWLGKILPLGVGAVLGTVANRKLARRVIRNGHESLGPLPQSFPFELPAKPTKEEKALAAAENDKKNGKRRLSLPSISRKNNNKQT